MDKSRIIELYNEMLGYLVELISDEKELIHVLHNIGFNDDEICYELGINLDDVRGIYND